MSTAPHTEEVAITRIAPTRFDGEGAQAGTRLSAGLTATGPLVTAAGLIMVAAFAGFMAGSIAELQQFGFALAAAVLVDVTLIRALLLPAAMQLFGAWNWVLPAGVARLLGVAPSPLRREAPPDA